MRFVVPTFGIFTADEQQEIKVDWDIEVHLKQEKVEPENTEIFEGLPGEAEYEVDLSDQDIDKDKEGESGVER